MELYAISKGNYPLEKTAKIFKHENNLRFHVKQNDRFYEYSINSWNKKTINLRCVKFKSNCKAKITLISGEHLKTEEKASNSKTKKFEWSSGQVDAFNTTGRKENLEKYLVLFSEKDDIPDLSDETE